MSDVGTWESAELANLCGVILDIDYGPNHWVIACTQDAFHEGPHVGLASWPAEERRPEVDDVG